MSEVIAEVQFPFCRPKEELLPARSSSVDSPGDCKSASRPQPVNPGFLRDLRARTRVSLILPESHLLQELPRFCPLAPSLPDASVSPVAGPRDINVSSLSLWKICQFVLRPACTARTWHPERRDVSPLLPTTGFIRLRIDALVRVRAFYVPVETRFSMRPFALRQRRLIFRSASAAGSTLLACSFETVLKSPPGPFGRRTPAPSRLFIALPGRDPHAKPVAKPDFRTPHL